MLLCFLLGKCGNCDSYRSALFLIDFHAISFEFMPVFRRLRDPLCPICRGHLRPRSIGPFCAKIVRCHLRLRCKGPSVPEIVLGYLRPRSMGPSVPKM